MRLSQVENKAKSMGIQDTWRFDKRDLIRKIQQSEGNSPCFGSVPRGGGCGNGGCCWREDCLK